MTSHRLTRTELTWLLAQEARSASHKLRQGVGSVSITEAAPPPLEEGTGGVESTLNKLDEAVGMLASLHGTPLPRGRRGRIDLAELLWEVAPEARVQLEVGAGTTVFGDEAEIRRMLHVLLGQSGVPASARGAQGISLRRVDDEVRIAVELGPDTPATFEVERVWLSRMAVRYGGRLNLDGSVQTLTLAADIDANGNELEALKRELAAAHAQGEAYARELAAFASRPDVGGVARLPNVLARPSTRPAGADELGVLAAASRVVAGEFRGILAAIGRDVAPLRELDGEAGAIAASVGRHVTAASALVADLARLGECPVGELPRHADVAEILREAASDELGRAARHDVRLVVNAPERAHDVVPAGALSVLLRALLHHAIAASPPGSSVAVTLEEQPSGLLVTFDDAGTTLPAEARSRVLSRDYEAVAPGRGPGLPLVAALAVSAHTRLGLEIDDAPGGGTRVKLAIPRSF